MPNDALTANAAPFRQSLLSWYDEHARDLPWRRDPSLYKTVVSEFMLQQTQVKTVLPYFASWLEAFPDFKSLAAADESRVLKRWEGLGYYSRARNLHRLAKAIVEMENVPRDAANWLAFPGVGPYAAAAICSISFASPAAVVDGNVVRILSRLNADEATYKNSTAAAKAYRSIADALLNHDRPGDHNQAMMELGATVCQKRKPQCLLCPVSRFCEGRQRGIEEQLPRLEKTTFEPVLVERAWVVSERGALLRQIPTRDKRMSGLHEIPTLEQVGLPIPSEDPILSRKRSITRYRITERFHRVASHCFLDELPPDCLWAKPHTIESLPFSGPHRKWIGELLEKEKSFARS